MAKVHKAFQGMWKLGEERYWRGTPLCQYTANGVFVAKTWKPVNCAKCLALKKRK